MLLRNRRSIQNALSLPILLISLMVVSGCSSVKDLQVFTKEVERTPLNLAEPPALKMEKLDWIIINEENYAKVFADLKKKNKDVVLFGLTDDGYETLAVNFAQVRKYIILNKNILKKYKDYYEGKKDGTEETRTRK